MQIDKQTILELLRERGQHGEAKQAEQELPDQVDHEEHSGLLDRFGVNKDELLSRLPGGLGGRF